MAGRGLSRSVELFDLSCAPTGIDLMDMMNTVFQPEGDDTARISWDIRKKIRKFQETFSVIEKVRADVPGLPNCFMCSLRCCFPISSNSIKVRLEFR